MLNYFKEIPQNLYDIIFPSEGKEKEVESSKESTDSFSNIPLPQVDSEITSKEIKDQIENAVSSFNLNAGEYFREWKNSIDNYSSKDVKDIMQPLNEQLDDYSENVQLSFNGIHAKATSTYRQLENYINESNREGHSGTSAEYSENIFSGKIVHVLYITAKKIEDLADYIGENVLGEEKYNNLKSIVYKYSYGFGRLIYAGYKSLVNFITRFFNTEIQTQDTENDSFKIRSGDSSDIAEAKEAKTSVFILMEKVESFLEYQKSYLSKNILDHKDEKDGIWNLRPDVVREELTPKISRPNFDPFPSKQIREMRESKE